MNRKRFLWSISAAAVVAAFGVLAGCAGSSSAPVQAPVALAGGAETKSATTAAAIAAPPAGGTTTTVSVGGVDTTVTVPAGAPAAAAGSNLGVLPSGSQALAGTYTAGAAVKVNDQTNSGLTVDATGHLNQNAALPATAAGVFYKLEFPAVTLASKVLDVASYEVSGTWYIGGGIFSVPLPLNLSGNLPNNGQNAAGSSATVTFLPGCNGRTATLKVTYGNGFVLGPKTKTISGNAVTFSDLSTDSSNVPAGGVQKVELMVGPLP